LDEVASNIWQLAGEAPVTSWVKARVNDVAGKIWQRDDGKTIIYQALGDGRS